MDNIRLYELLGYVKISPYRTNTLKSIGNELKMPSEIAKELDIKTSQVSAALSDLKKENLVVCVNEEVRKGRLYKCTPMGLELLKKID
ncbi:MAG: MarR family transcriptional regulator [Methanobrevibacter sp.]|uniref:MarR family transcriptional regulator n=1 Tax=uncultured Methanobrevibacter sp. TaxID=253161 RepID=UPI0025E3049F|nr:MarR family transcriptional regulator [uncultured Methanobrevibacter sp.]MEE1129907.1 MarR family transcriptional regulator [Methanobrevibacter sp.]